jgi:hypothetical protein
MCGRISGVGCCGIKDMARFVKKELVVVLVFVVDVDYY